jgi:hypothetical protein
MSTLAAREPACSEGVGAVELLLRQSPDSI